MATDVERLVVSLEASITKYERAMQKALGQTNATTKRIENRFAKMNASLGSQFGRLFGAFAAGATARGFQRLIDSSTRIQNSLRVAGLEGESLNRVYESLYESAQRNAAPLESLADLYGRVALVQKELGASTEEMLRFTDNVAVALRVAGKDAQSASGALLQLSQAMGSGVVRAEEFNSILEGALPIAQAAAAGLKEAGGSVARLRQLVVDGKVSSEAFFRAFEAGASTLQDRVAGANLTASQAFTTLYNSMTDAARRIDNVTDVSGLLVEEVQTLAGWVDYAADRFEDWAGPLQTVAEWVEKIRNFFKELREVAGIESFFEGTALLEGKIGFADPATKALEQRAAAVDELRKKLVQGQQEAAAAAKGNDKIAEMFAVGFGERQVSLDDFETPDGDKDKGKRENAYQRELRQFQERQRALESELMLVGQTEQARDRARAVLELENAALQAKIPINDKIRAQIDATADAYAEAAERARQAEDRYQAIQTLQQEFGELAMDGITGLIDGTKTLNDVLADTLKRLGEMALQAALLGQGPLGQLFGLGGASGGVGGLFGALFGGFRAGGGSVQAGRAYVVGEKRPELFVPNQSGMIIPKVPRTVGGSGQVVNVSVVQDNRGADPAAVARLEANQPRLIQEAVRQSIAATREGLRVNSRFLSP